MSWIHIDDEVALILWALDNEQVSGVVNATAPNHVTNREFSKSLARAGPSPPRVDPDAEVAVARSRAESWRTSSWAAPACCPARRPTWGLSFAIPRS